MLPRTLLGYEATQRTIGDRRRVGYHMTDDSESDHNHSLTSLAISGIVRSPPL